MPLEQRRIGKPRKGDRIPYGKGRTDVRWVVSQNAKPNGRFNHHDVWGWMDTEMKAEWRFIYGTTKQAISRVAQALNSIYQKVPNSQFDLVKVKHKAATYVWRPLGWAERPMPELDYDEHPTPPPLEDTRDDALHRESGGPDVPTMPPPQLPEPYVSPTYTLFGHSLDGVELWIDGQTGAIGFIEFIGITNV